MVDEIFFTKISLSKYLHFTLDISRRLRDSVVVVHHSVLWVAHRELKKKHSTELNTTKFKNIIESLLEMMLRLDVEEFLDTRHFQISSTLKNTKNQRIPCERNIMPL